MAAIETCFKKKTGVFGEFSDKGFKDSKSTEMMSQLNSGDYSEQQLVDCGYEKNGATEFTLSL